MFAALMLDEKTFPHIDNVRLWLGAQSGERAAALGDLAVRGRYSIAYARKAKAWFVFRFADVTAGKVPNVGKLPAGVELEPGVKAYEAPAQ